MLLKDYRKLFVETPCQEAQEWLKTQNTFEEAWNNCKRGDWLWWALQKSKNVPDKSVSCEYANWCAERSKKYSRYYAYAAADYAAYAAADAADAEKFEQAKWIREHIKNPFVPQ